MKISNTPLPTAAALALALGLAMSPPLVAAAYAQSTSTPSAAFSTMSEATVKALQEALNKQGIAVRRDGVMNDETRNAIRKYQSQHHLPVTGEADKATLDKLGVVGQLGTPPSSTTTLGQGSTTSSAEHDHSHGAGGATGGPMMPGMMQGMMQAMHGMMGMMRGQMQSDQKPSGSMPGGPMMAQQGGPMNCPMMSESNQAPGPQMMQMMQMMQGMMQMMETMQKQMQSQQNP